MLTFEWKKSERSNGTGGSNCVTVKKDSGGQHILVKDSKENGSGIQKTLSFTVAEWEAFIAGVKLGEFDI